MTKISIALPVYNGADFIKEAIESILIQDYKDFELVIVDNASKDDTFAIADSFAQKDNRIKLFSFKEHLGQVDNVNRTAQLCNYEWIHFFCHDDIMLQGCVKNVVETIEKIKDNTDIALISHKPAVLYMNGIVKAPSNMIDGKSVFKYEYFVENFRIDSLSFKIHNKRETAYNIINGKVPYLPALTTGIVKKEVFEVLGGFDKEYIHFDIFLWMNLLKNSSYLELNKAFTLTRIHGNQVAIHARKSLRTIKDHKIFWKKYLNTITNKPTLRQKTFVFLKPITTATGIITIAIMRFGIFSGLKVLFKLPIYWLPFILIYYPKRYLNEKKNNKELLKHVPIEMVHP